MIVVAVTLAATLAIQLGYFLWKLAADEIPPIGTTSGKAVVRRLLGNRKWMLGLVLTVIGWLLFVKAADLGEVSIVQPLMSVGDVFLVLLAVVFLGERLSRMEWLGLAITVVGAVWLASEAALVAPETIDWPRMAAFLLLAAAAGFAICVVAWRSERAEGALAVVVGIAFGTGAVLTELMTAYLRLQGQDLESVHFLLNPILPLMVLANVAGLVLLQVAFQRGRASVVVPIQLGIGNALVAVAGGLVFAESIGVSRLLGIGCIVGGTGLLHLARRGSAGSQAS